MNDAVPVTCNTYTSVLSDKCKFKSKACFYIETVPGDGETKPKRSGNRWNSLIVDMIFSTTNKRFLVVE